MKNAFSQDIDGAGVGVIGDIVGEGVVGENVGGEGVVSDTPGGNTVAAGRPSF